MEDINVYSTPNKFLPSSCYILFVSFLVFQALACFSRLKHWLLEKMVSLTEHVFHPTPQCLAHFLHRNSWSPVPEMEAKQRRAGRICGWFLGALRALRGFWGPSGGCLGESQVSFHVFWM